MLEESLRTSLKTKNSKSSLNNLERSRMLKFMFKRLARKIQLETPSLKESNLDLFALKLRKMH